MKGKFSSVVYLSAFINSATDIISAAVAAIALISRLNRHSCRLCFFLLIRRIPFLVDDIIITHNIVPIKRNSTKNVLILREKMTDTQLTFIYSTVHQSQSTLPRRERRQVSKLTASDIDFNPRSREGSDKEQDAKRWKTGSFQSTLPRRERPINTEGLRHPERFQSTLPRRERRKLVGYRRFTSKFQSTLPRRERLRPSY